MSKKRKRGYSKIETGWFGGKHIQYYNEDGKKTGYAKQGIDWAGKKITQRYTQEGKKRGYSRSEIDRSGRPYMQRYTQEGKKTGYSKKRIDSHGRRYTQHYSQNDKAKSYSMAETYWGNAKHTQRYSGEILYSFDSSGRSIPRSKNSRSKSRPGNYELSSHDHISSSNSDSSGFFLFVVIIVGFAIFLSTLSLVWQILLLSGIVIIGAPLLIFVWKTYQKGINERIRVEREQQEREQECRRLERIQYLRQCEQDDRIKEETKKEVEKMITVAEHKRYEQMRQIIKDEGVSALETILSADDSDLRIANNFAVKISESHDKGCFPGPHERQIILDNVKTEVMHREETRKYLEDLHDREISDDELDRWIAIMSGNVTKIRTISVNINGETTSKVYINGEEEDMTEYEIFKDVLASSYDEDE